MRVLRFILGLYVLVWFTFVVPAHTRGVVSLPGSQQLSGCCTTNPPQDSGSRSNCPTPSSQTNCAICIVAANYTLPPIYVFYVEPLELLQTVNDHAVAQLLSLDYPAPYWPVGPPTSA